MYILAATGLAVGSYPVAKTKQYRITGTCSATGYSCTHVLYAYLCIAEGQDELVAILGKKLIKSFLISLGIQWYM